MMIRDFIKTARAIMAGVYDGFGKPWGGDADPETSHRRVAFEAGLEAQEKKRAELIATAQAEAAANPASATVPQVGHESQLVVPAGGFPEERRVPDMFEDLGNEALRTETMNAKAAEVTGEGPPVPENPDAHKPGGDLAAAMAAKYGNGTPAPAPTIPDVPLVEPTRVAGGGDAIASVSAAPALETIPFELRARDSRFIAGQAMLGIGMLRGHLDHLPNEVLIELQHELTTTAALTARVLLKRSTE